MVDELDELDEELDDDDESLGVDDELPESDDEPDESDDDVVELSLVEPDGVVDDDLPRLSFLKNPLPLNVTPTGWNTFLTGIGMPESGCSISVRVLSVNDCWTSMVSPLSTNLYTYVGITALRIPRGCGRSTIAPDRKRRMSQVARRMS